MAGKRKDKSIRITNSQVGVVGDNATISGGVHFHHYDSGKQGADPREEPGAPIEESPFDPSEAADILHLSDLHFGADEHSDPLADAERWFGQLRDDLRDELGCERLHGVVISGDIGNKSEKAEYEAAEVFLDKLRATFGVGADRLVIVPGNHDLNWETSEESYRLVRRKALSKEPKAGSFYEESKAVIALRDDAAYPDRFQQFSRFHEIVAGSPYPPDPKVQITLHHLPDLNLLIIGFNSAWEADHHFRNRISINPDAVEHALNQIRENPDLKERLKIAVWHHPLSSPEEDRITDLGFMQRLAQAGFQVCLHGHIHKADAGLFRYDMSADGRRIHVAGAGTFGAPAREWTSGYPLQYNLLRLSGNVLRVETRRRIEIYGAWEPDHLWRQGRGKPNLPYYDIPFQGRDSTSPKPEPMTPGAPVTASDFKTDADFEKEIAAYCQKAEALHEKLPLFGFKTNLKVPIDIADIYVSLRAMMDLRPTGHSCFADAEDAEKCLRGQGVEQEISVPDAFRAAEGMATPRRGLVILGDPGSGKTTHLKRVLLWCLRGGPVQLGLPKEMVPVFLPLRDLEPTAATLDAFIQEQLSDPLLETPAGFGKRLMERGSLLFLLDGLDEVADPDQRGRVSRWIERALTLNRNRDCRFVVTCRFAGYTEDARLSADFLEMHVRPLDGDQAADFVNNWYRIVETGLAADKAQAAKLAKTKADDLLERLKQPEFRAQRVFELTRNPLLLTNICLIHQSQGGLPDTRSQLYEECVEVLLEKWRKAIGFTSRVTARTGRRVLQPAAYWMHRKERRRASASELAPVIEPPLKAVNWDDESAADFLHIVRDESGLLTGWSQDQYGFMHLGFQEYLAAREIQRLFLADLGKSEVLCQLAEKFGSGWWQEVILLLLAQADHCLFDPFMREVVKRPGFVEHADLLGMCLDESAERTPEPFADLLNLDAAGNPERLWERQLAALRILERLDGGALEAIMDRLRGHPYDKIRQWVEERYKEERQDVIHPEPSGYELVLIEGGAFMMGSKESGDENPFHKVTVPDFYMGRYPVTNEEYGRFLKATGYEEPEHWADRKFNQTKQPVVGVSWHDAKKFAEWAGLQLPSEAQWEYACRAGTTTKFSWGDEPDCSKANYGNSSFAEECKDANPGKTSPVGDYPPNARGLYDMHGNVWEWCEDHYHDSYEDAPADGSAWVDQEKDASRVLRGGAWDDPAERCRTAFRFRDDPGDRYADRGFRLALRPGQQGEPSQSSRAAERGID